MLVDRLKDLRRSHGVSQKDFANILGVSQQAVASWEVGRTEPAHNTLKAIADYFNVSTDYLLGNDYKKKTPVFSEEESNLVSSFRKLNEESKRLILGMIGQLAISRRTA